MRKLSYLLIILGLIVLIAPKWFEWRADVEQAKLLRETESAQTASLSEDIPANLAESYSEVSRILEEEPDEEALADSTNDLAEVGDSIATIEIEKIDLKLPVLEGATKKNMKNAAAHMSETAPLGGNGNAAIAAHRARTEGRLFNRLNEVEIGDKIEIRTATETYNYTVYQKKVVKPTDVSVLNGSDSDQILTLITCHPLKNPTHRLIVQAKLES